MFGLTFEKLLLIGVIAAFLVGPQRLPVYAAKLAAIVRAVRGFADTARERVVAGIGVDDTDWKALDPRQYDPRRIVRDALADPASERATVSPGSPALTASGVPASDVSASADRSSAPATASAPATRGWQAALLARVPAGGPARPLDAAQSTGFESTPMPEISTSTVSPASMKPMPAGVPVRITSPGSKVNTAEA